MPWFKATSRMHGGFDFDLRNPFKTAEDCMNSFTRFEKDDSFGPLTTCRPIFFPLNDEELKGFYELQRKANEAIEEQKKFAASEELAENLLTLVKNLNKHLEISK